MNVRRNNRSLPDGISGRARRALLAIALAFACAIAGAPRALAGVYQYQTAVSKRPVNCGILLLDSADQSPSPTGTTPDLPGPYPFYILNQRSDIEPSGWNIVNPLAPTVVTSDIRARYSSEYVLGSQVTPNMAAYWQISLVEVAKDFANGTDDLSQFNLLVIHTKNLIGLSRQEREVLRQYVDEGGTLWVEDRNGSGSTMAADADYGGTDTPAGLFIDANFQDGSVGNATVGD